MVRSLEDRLRQFYARHNPSKLSAKGASSISKVAEFYEGKEAELNAALKKQYGVGLDSLPLDTASTGESLLSRLQRFYKEHEPSKLSAKGSNSIEKLAEYYEDKEDVLEAALVKRYGVGLASLSPEEQAPALGGMLWGGGGAQQASASAATEESLESRLRRFYKVHQPSKLNVTGPNSIEKVAEYFEGREDELEAAFVKQYGVGLASLDSPSRPPQLGPPESLLNRLRRFYAIHEPSKLGATGNSSIEALVEHFASRESDLEAALVRQYGVGLASLPPPPSPPNQPPAMASAAALAPPPVGDIPASLHALSRLRDVSMFHPGAELTLLEPAHSKRPSKRQADRSLSSLGDVAEAEARAKRIPVYAGDDITLRAVAKHNGRLYILHVDEEGKLTLVFPNVLSPDNAVRRGDKVQVPPDGSERRYLQISEARAGKSLGRETFFAVSCTESLEGLMTPRIELNRKLEPLSLEQAHALLMTIERAPTIGGLGDRALSSLADATAPELGVSSLELLSVARGGQGGSSSFETPQKPSLRPRPEKKPSASNPFEMMGMQKPPPNPFGGGSSGPPNLLDMLFGGGLGMPTRGKRSRGVPASSDGGPSRRARKATPPPL